jgi:endonuclease V-like protein UPF0215 family
MADKIAHLALNNNHSPAFINQCHVIMLESMTNLPVFFFMKYDGKSSMTCTHHTLFYHFKNQWVIVVRSVQDVKKDTISGLYYFISGDVSRGD